MYIYIHIHISRERKGGREREREREKETETWHLGLSEVWAGVFRRRSPGLKDVGLVRIASMPSARTGILTYVTRP